MEGFEKSLKLIQDNAREKAKIQFLEMSKEGRKRESKKGKTIAR